MARPSRRADWGGMRLSRLTVPALALLVAGGCTSSAWERRVPPARPRPRRRPGPPPSPGAWDWPNYHRDPAHTGFAEAPPAGPLSIAWNAPLDGAVYGQPLVVGGPDLRGHRERHRLRAEPATNGAVIWSAHVGTPVPLSDLPCGNIDPLGITSTMVYDPATNRVFAVAETTGGEHTLFGFTATAGSR